MMILGPNLTFLQRISPGLQISHPTREANHVIKTCCNCLNCGGEVTIRCKQCLDRPFRFEEDPASAIHPGSPPQGSDEVHSITLSNLENLIEVLANGNLAQWYAGWEKPTEDSVPEPNESKIKDLDYVYQDFKIKKRISSICSEDINSNLIRAYVMAGNLHPAKDPATKHLFSQEPPDVGLTYEWSLGLSKGRGVLGRLNDPVLIGRLKNSNPLIWIDVFFIDQLSKNITMDLAKAQGIYKKCKFHVVLLTSTLLSRGWCLFELCLRHHANMESVLVGDLKKQAWNYDYLGKMQLYDFGDKKAIYWSLNRIFDHNDDKINAAIMEQIGAASTRPIGAAQSAVFADPSNQKW
eukprot:CAMPEP_0172199678 /NCGR_PEP_ID=MMETSP1050-20130122/28833_1 /TAXON_ID=233186 /ORGANISM="Cryptomonas curvata, Strain CCAP979/52" /LENGTH=350 /DNA_ID=CAMNT_0012876751 /DNA_START=216 /DNA_END=1266 /DNA_ORIENTATION=+